MAVGVNTFTEIKSLILFGEEDAANLRQLAPLFARHGAALTDGFYAGLAEIPETAKQIAGRVDALKLTHNRWMGELFQGDYGQAYFENRLRIGQAHVRIALAPHFVEGVMSVLRREGIALILAEYPDRARAATLIKSYIKVLDLDLMIIGLAFADSSGSQRLDRLSRFTGMSRRLLENCIHLG